MAKYLLLKHYRGGPAPAMDWAPMDQWTPDEVEAHIQFMRDCRRPVGGAPVNSSTRQALSPDGVVGPLRRRGATAGDRRPVRLRRRT